jgi:ECF sigma factor
VEGRGPFCTLCDGDARDNSLQATALVNEAYLLRLIDIRQIDWENRSHFLAMAVRLMRRVLVDAARAKRYQKRGVGGSNLFGSARSASVVARACGLLSLWLRVTTCGSL